jgi:gluconolactonase
MHIETHDPAFDAIVGPDAAVERLAHDLYFGEGPVWDARTSTFYFTEIIGDAIWRWREGGGCERLIHPSGHANGLTLDHDGRLVVAGWSQRSVWRVESDGRHTTLVSAYQGQKLNGPNDIVVRSDGSIYWTDPPGGLGIPGMGGDDIQRYLPFQGVFCRRPDGEVLLAIEDCVYPNGLAFSRDERQLFVNDTRQGLIRVFDLLPDGRCGPGRLFHKLIGEEPGVADGMKLDERGNLYCTGPGGLHVVGPDGRLLGRILLPGHCSNMAWGGSDLKWLFVTTYHDVYRIRMRVAGLPTPAAPSRVQAR